MMLEFKNPIPVVIKETKQDAMAIYAVSGGTFENDIWTVVVCATGDIISVRVDQISMYANKTFDIEKQDK